MNKLLRHSFVLMLSLAAAASYAQQPEWIIPPAGKPAKKTTGTISRLVWHARSGYWKGNFTATDSFHYAYSGDNAWDDLLQDWKYDQQNTTTDMQRIVQTFDNNNRVIRREASGPKSSGYTPMSATSYTYQNNLPTEFKYEHYVNGKWEDAGRKKITYDGMGRVIELAYLDEKISSDRKETYIYSSDGLILVENATKKGNVWQPGWKMEVSYAGGKRSKTDEWTYKNGGWVASRQTYYTYGGSRPDLISTLEVGAMQGAADSSITEYHYDGNGNIDTSTRYTRKNSENLPVIRYFTAYNTHNQPIKQHGQIWNESNNQWEFEDGTYENRWHYFEFDLGVQEKVDVQTKLSLYPVPATNSITMEVSINKPQLLNVNIVHADGRMVRSWGQPASGDYYKETIDVSALPSGSYYIKLFTDAGVVTSAFNIAR